MAAMGKDSHPEIFPRLIESNLNALSLPGFMADLARLEWACHLVCQNQTASENDSGDTVVNPTLSLMPVDWEYLDHLINSKADMEIRNRIYCDAYRYLPSPR